MKNILTEKKLKVCIIEDEKMISEMYQIKLEEENYEVYTAEDGKKGFELIKRVRPDIAIIDITMPQCDGITLVKNIRKDPEIARTSVIISTNVDNQKTVEKTYDLDIDFYLIKSQYKPSDVAKMVNEVLDTKHLD